MSRNSLDAVVNSVCQEKPVVIVHVLSGGYITKEADLQIRAYPLKANTDKRHLWQVICEDSADGLVTYRFQSAMADKKQMAIDPNNPTGTGVLLQDARPLHESGQQADAQRWYIRDLCDGCYVISPLLFPDLVLGPIDKVTDINACFRLVEAVGGVAPLTSCVQFAPPTAPLDPLCARSARGGSGDAQR
ncbi:hypothetical protein [Streptomyces flavalbus]|uniref:Ricin B lectin domain-containing protein n=1 Tax=Streptomyces flavalbus TaxID=2665155 RepID=A0ABW2WFQ7_9ACTN